jgi:hypothetical protein
MLLEHFAPTPQTPLHQLGGDAQGFGDSLDRNGEPVKDMSITPTLNWLAPPETRLRFGLQTSHMESYGPEGYDAWFDEIAVANERIGCER